MGRVIGVIGLGRRWRALFLLFLGGGLVPARSFARDKTTSGEFFIDPPTLVSLGFEWRISGDDNRNARVDVTYRKKGEREWREALPLLRLERESVLGGHAARRRGPLFQVCGAQHVCRQHPESRAGNRI